MPSSVDKLIRRLGDSGGPRFIRAYHGSPYDFDRFDASKIGTGEGAQSYGHGLYLAGNEDVARGYRNALRWRDWDTANPAKRAAMWVESRGGRAEALAALQDAIDKSYFGRSSLDATLNQRAIDHLRSGGDIPPPPPGHMYAVEIGYPEEALLNWDKPMGEAMAARLTPKLRVGLERGIQDRLDLGQLGRHADNLRAMRDNPALATGQVLHEGLSADVGSASAARGLLNAGIPGIRYLDQGSRAAGQGTRNYVMFPGTEDSIRILRKYGLLAPMAAGALQEGE